MTDFYDIKNGEYDPGALNSWRYIESLPQLRKIHHSLGICAMFGAVLELPNGQQAKEHDFIYMGQLIKNAIHTRELCEEIKTL